MCPPAPYAKATEPVKFTCTNVTVQCITACGKHALDCIFTKDIALHVQFQIVKAYYSCKDKYQGKLMFLCQFLQAIENRYCCEYDGDYDSEYDGDGDDNADNNGHDSW